MYIPALGLLLSLALPAAAQWSRVEALQPSQKLEVVAVSGEKTKGTLAEAGPDQIVVLSGADRRAIPRSEIRFVRVPSTGRRILNGSIGLALGIVGGVFSCPTCRGEGGIDQANRNLAIGIGVGSLAFLIPGYKTIYKAPKGTK